MSDILLFIDNKEKIFTFFQSLPIYFYLIILITFLLFFYFYFKSKNNSKVVSWWSINIEWNWNIVHK